MPLAPARPFFRLTLRAKIVLYLVLIHAALAAVSLVVLAHNRLLLLAVEGLFVLSIALGAMLVRSFFVPLDLIRTGADLIGERDFTSSFQEIGQPEMDALIGVYNQMIERLREERLKQQEQHYFLDRILAASPAGVITLDFDGRLSAWNPSAERLLRTSAGPAGAAGAVNAGGGAGEILGRPLAEIASPLGPPLAALPVGESQVLALPGGRRLKAARAEFFDRGFARSFYFLEELTEELRASEKSAYGKLIRMMSHEINNSVGAVGSLLDSFRAYGSQLAEADRDDFTQGIAVAIGRLEKLGSFMNGFAGVVRLPPPELRPVDPRRLLDELLLLLRPELERRRIRCEWIAAAAGQTPGRPAVARRPPGQPAAAGQPATGDGEPAGVIAMDRNQIEQVLVNVLQNAIESIGEDGRIVLRLASEGRRPVLSIRDTGAGIPESARELLFTPFFSTKKNGRGLGLTLTQEILSRHGFAFSLGSVADSLGGGAEFRIRF
ncbi:MAG TPA: ATP-binding protein [Thermoanaerobaculia bacterium]|nr:ATP-binding protein [Thermoanaerobaculia bacterium]